MATTTAIRALLYKSSNILELVGLKNAVTDAYITGATVQATLYDQAGAEVAGQVWPLALTYDGGGTGTYRGTVSENLAVQVNDQIEVVITANAGVGAVRRWRLWARVEEG